MPVSSSFDPGARIIDYVYREVNPTFEKYILPKKKYWKEIQRTQSGLFAGTARQVQRTE